MATFFRNGDPGCDASNWNRSQHPASFAPSSLNVSQWIDSMNALGAREAVLTAKHGCGFLLWPTSTGLPDGTPYGYHVPPELNVLELFSSTMRAAGLGHGFYYSLTNNFFLDVYGHYVQNSSLLPGQRRVSQAQFEALATAQVQELWTRFGNLTEIWFDGGYTSDMQARLQALLARTQPGAIGYNGGGISGNPARWSKTEGDVPPGGPDVWSTACGDVDWGAGAPPEKCPGGTGTAPFFYPSGTDYTLQANDVWFWEPSQALRPLDELIFAYHSTVGHNTVLELDFAIDRTGQVDASHVSLYRRLGDWIRACYGSPLATATAAAASPTASTVAATADLGAGGRVFDRVVLAEDQRRGQRVRGWVLEWKPPGGGTAGAGWRVFASGQSIGAKRIALAAGAQSHLAAAVRLSITSSYPAGAAPGNVTLAVHAPCSSGTPAALSKLGTEDVGMTETTPVVWRGQLFRFESVRAGHYNNSLNCTNESPGLGRKCTPYLRFRRQAGPAHGWASGEIATTPFGLGWVLACAIADEEGADATRRIWAFASQETREIAAFSAGDIALGAAWTQTLALTLPDGYVAFNTGVARANASQWAMAIEVYAARSRTLQYGSWEPSPRNPLLVADARDRAIHNDRIPGAQRGWARNTSDLNDSDIDLVEFDGHVLLVYNWGDQRSTPTNSLAQAVFNGTLAQFFASLYERPGL